MSSVIILFTVVPVYAQNLVKNSGFETGELLPYWHVWPNNIIPVAVIEAENVFSGNFCARLNGDEVYFYQPVNLEPNTTYTISATIKSGSGDSVLFAIDNIYSTGGESKYFTNTNYETKSWSFTTDESPGNNPGISVLTGINSGVVWIDSVVLIKEPQVNLPKPPPVDFSTYYVSPSGNDANTGKSQTEPWQTINKVNSRDFGPADEILFEGGKTFDGTIVLNSDDHGTTGSEVLIGSYGVGRATINAQNGSGLIAYDCNNVSVKNLVFIGNGPTGGNTGNGITFSYCSDITIDSVEVSGFQHSGLKVNNLGENYTLTNIKAHHNGYAGIYISGLNKSSLSNIYIGYCSADSNLGDPTVLDNHSGSGIFAYNANNILIEFCVASNNGEYMPRTGNGPGGIWVAEVDSVVIQHCISHDNKTSVGGLDGLGFDLDGGTTNTIIQYCLSYNNQGAGYGIFQYDGATDWNNNTVRYCISENDGNTSSVGSVVLWNGSNESNKFQGFEFYNNIVYNANGPALAFLDHYNSNINFRNNIFVSQQQSVYNWANNENFQANCWYSLNGKFYLNSVLDFEQWTQNNNQEMLNGVVVGMYADPVFVNPGNSTITDPTQLASVNHYKVLNGSPVIDSGLDLNSIFNLDTGNKDYFGNLIQRGMDFDIGIYQYINKQILNFDTGWNIMSSNILPANQDIKSFFQSIIDNNSLVKVQDENGNSLEYLSFLGVWNNSIGDMLLTDGYKVKVSADDMIEICGPTVKFPYEIPLKTGWNIISFPQTTVFNGKDVVQQLIDKDVLVKVQDEDGNSIEYLSFLGEWNNSIVDFLPGKGYKVKVSADDTLWIYNSYPKSGAIKSELITTNHFQPAFEGNGVDHMNIYLANPEVVGIIAGDEIGIFNGGICVGATKITNQKSSVINLIASAYDGSVEKINGFADGGEIQLKLFRNGKEYLLSLKTESDVPGVFEKNGSLVVAATLDVNTGIEIAENELSLNCYPNPFHDIINIEVKLQNDENLTVEVYDMHSRKVRQLYSGKASGTIKLKWDGNDEQGNKVANGVYLFMVNEKWGKVILGRN